MNYSTFFHRLWWFFFLLSLPSAFSICLPFLSANYNYNYNSLLIQCSTSFYLFFHSFSFAAIGELQSILIIIYNFEYKIVDYDVLKPQRIVHVRFLRFQRIRTNSYWRNTLVKERSYEASERMEHDTNVC